MTWPPTQDLWQPPGAEKGSGEFPLRVSVGSMACRHLTLDFWPQTRLLLKPPILQVVWDGGPRGPAEQRVPGVQRIL